MGGRIALPPREKLIRRKPLHPDALTPRAVSEWHLYCAGEGCGKRLAIRQESRDSGGQLTDVSITLEPRYARDAGTGTWGRQQTGGYWGTDGSGGIEAVPRARDSRKALRSAGLLEPEAALPSGLLPAIEGARRVQLGLPRRGTRRPVLALWLRQPDGAMGVPPRPDEVACYQCGGLALIDATALAS